MINRNLIDDLDDIDSTLGLPASLQLVSRDEDTGDSVEFARATRLLVQKLDLVTLSDGTLVGLRYLDAGGDWVQISDYALGLDEGEDGSA